MIEEVKSAIQQYDDGLITECELALKLLELSPHIYNECKCGSSHRISDIAIEV